MLNRSLALLGGVAAVAPTVAAASRPLPLREVESLRAGSRVLPAGPDAVAWIGAHGDVVVRHDDGRRVRVPIPAGCERGQWGDAGLVATGGGRLLFRCPGLAMDHYVYVSAALDGADAVRLDLPYVDSAGGAWLSHTAIGGRWIVQYFAGNHEVIRRFVRWRTGEIRLTGGDEDGPADERGTFEDLDAVHPRRPLCRPFAGLDPEPWAGSPLIVSLPFVARPSSDGARFQVQRCGRRRPILTVPTTHFATQPLLAELGRGWLAYGHLSSAGTPRPLMVVRLADLRHFVVARAHGEVQGMVLTRRRLYVTVATGPESWALRTVRVARLPHPQAPPRARSDDRR